MKKLLQDFLDFYSNSLLIGFFKRRGKSLVIPQIIYCVERLLERYPKSKRVKILDLGCGEGNLLRVLDQVGKISGFTDRLEFYGFDYDDDMLESAKAQNNIRAEFIKLDLRHDTLEPYFGKFDIVVAVNTLHEVYSSLVGDNVVFPGEKIGYAKQEVKRLIGDIANMLSEDGSFILYDGLAPRVEVCEENIKFKLTSEVLERYFDKAVTDFTLWKIKYKKVGKTYEMKYRDFAWFVVTFKYLNTKLWPFECAQTYQYFSKREFAQAFHASGLMRESVVYLSNDLGLWKNNIQIVTPDADFPPKSVMIVGSKHYIPSQYDYFAAN